MNELTVREYLGNRIEFKMVDGHVYANANQMANGFGGNQKLADWKRSENTKRYMEALNKNKLWKNSIISEEGRNGGTWIHEKLVLNFARYLNVEFELWCDEQIATLLREGKVELKKTVKSLSEKTPYEILEDNGKALNGFFGSLGLNIPKEIIASTAIIGTQNSTGYDFHEVKLLLNKTDEEEYHSASGLLIKLGIKRNRTNETLTILGLQSKGTTSMQPYVLTDLGAKYGVERAYTNKNHQGYEIKWKENLLEYIKEHKNDIPVEFFK